MQVITTNSMTLAVDNVTTPTGWRRWPLKSEDGTIHSWLARRWPTSRQRQETYKRVTTGRAQRESHTSKFNDLVMVRQLRNNKHYRKTAVNGRPRNPRETGKNDTSSVGVNRTRNRTWTLRQFRSHIENATDKCCAEKSVAGGSTSIVTDSDDRRK